MKSLQSSRAVLEIGNNNMLFSLGTFPVHYDLSEESNHENTL